MADDFTTNTRYQTIARLTLYTLSRYTPIDAGLFMPYSHLH
jgi:hypothetical protein